MLTQNACAMPFFVVVSTTTSSRAMSSPSSMEDSPASEQQDQRGNSPDSVTQGDTTRLPPAENNRSKTLSEVSWTDVAEDANGDAFTVAGLELTALKSHQLRTVISRLKLQGLKNAKKSVMVDAIKTKHKLFKAYSRLDDDQRQQEETRRPGTTATRKEQQCTFRLVNLLFSDKFAEDFSNTGKTPTREALDQGLVAKNHKAFWDRVRNDFVNDIDEYHLVELDEEDKELFANLGSDIDPGKIVPHSAEKLRDSIWKDLNSEYKKAMDRFTKSGEHNSNFFDYCYGKLDVYYLYKKLKNLRPGLNEFVLAELPNSCTVESDENFDNRSVASSNSSKRQKRNKAEKTNAASLALANSIRETFHTPGEAQLAQQRVTFMLAEEERRKGEEVRKSKEDLRRDKEEMRRSEENERSGRKQNLDEWERIRLVIRGINEDLRNPQLDEEEKKDLWDERDGLKKRKNEIAKSLGLA